MTVWYQFVGTYVGTLLLEMITAVVDLSKTLAETELTKVPGMRTGEVGNNLAGGIETVGCEVIGVIVEIASAGTVIMTLVGTDVGSDDLETTTTLVCEVWTTFYDDEIEWANKVGTKTGLVNVFGTTTVDGMCGIGMWTGVVGLGVTVTWWWIVVMVGLMITDVEVVYVHWKSPGGAVVEILVSSTTYVTVLWITWVGTCEIVEKPIPVMSDGWDKIDGFVTTDLTHFFGRSGY
jgi:hypothetical protein